MKRCERCGYELPDFMFITVRPNKYICIPCGTEIVKLNWDDDI